MHRVLQIQEVLLNIFGYCRVPLTRDTAPNLLALAKTCRAFKEPALDVLWEQLTDASAIARCLPEASYEKYKVDVFKHSVAPLSHSEYFRSTIPQSVIRLADHLLRSNGVSFGVTHVASDQ